MVRVVPHKLRYGKIRSYCVSQSNMIIWLARNSWGFIKFYSIVVRRKVSSIRRVSEEILRDREQDY